MLSIPCLVVHENQYFRKKCAPDVSESTLQAALDAVANHANCAGVTLEDGVYSGRETLELFATPRGKDETSYNIHCEPPLAAATAADRQLVADVAPALTPAPALATRLAASSPHHRPSHRRRPAPPGRPPKHATLTIPTTPAAACPRPRPRRHSNRTSTTRTA